MVSLLRPFVLTVNKWCSGWSLTSPGAKYQNIYNKQESISPGCVLPASMVRGKVCITPMDADPLEADPLNADHSDAESPDAEPLDADPLRGRHAWKQTPRRKTPWEVDTSPCKQIHVKTLPSCNFLCGYMNIVRDICLLSRLPCVKVL